MSEVKYDLLVNGNAVEEGKGRAVMQILTGRSTGADFVNALEALGRNPVFVKGDAKDEFVVLKSNSQHPEPRRFRMATRGTLVNMTKEAKVINEAIRDLQVKGMQLAGQITRYATVGQTVKDFTSGNDL